MRHFDHHNILCENQHGFRKRRSCDTQLLVTIEDIVRNRAKGSQVDIILLDFAKAFDKVPHARLAIKLNFYGIRDNTAKWITSFLSNRSQRVVVNGAQSSKLDVLSGVPQGTVLGPLLFLAYINDMPKSCKSANTRLFADDSLLYSRIDSTDDSIRMQQDLAALEEWESDWQMAFNPTKCSVIRVSPTKRTTIPYDYILHGQTLAIEESSKYLGVTLNSKCDWEDHINITTKKANRNLGFLRRNFHSCSTPVKKTTYTAIVRPSLEYAAATWDPVTKKHINQLEQVQRRAARYATNNYKDRSPGSVTSMMKDLGWETLESRRRNIRLAMLYRINYGLVDVNKDTYLQRNDSRTRGQLRFFQERIQYQPLNNSFFPRTIRDWNTLPSNITDAITLDGFRLLLSKSSHPDTK